MDRRLKVPVLILVLLVVALGAAAKGIEGTKAPDFTLKEINGKRVKLSDYLEKGPVLLDFWATWCAPCKQALPYLADIYNKYKDEGFTLMAISVDNTRSVGKVRPYIRSQKWDFPVPLDTDQEVLKRYRGNNIPHMVLIGGDGMIRKVWIGYQPGEEEEIEVEIQGLLASRSLAK